MKKINAASSGVSWPMIRDGGIGSDRKRYAKGNVVAKMWIELLYVLTAALVAAAILANLPEKSKSRPTLISVPCQCMSV